MATAYGLSLPLMMFAVAKQQVLLAGLVLRAWFQAQSHDCNTKARRAKHQQRGFEGFLLNDNPNYVN